MAFKFNPVTGNLDLVTTDTLSPFITVGTTGITTIRWASTPSGNLFDMTIDDTGHVVTTAVVVSASLIPLWFTYYPQ